MTTYDTAMNRRMNRERSGRVISRGQRAQRCAIGGEVRNRLSTYRREDGKRACREHYAVPA